MIFFYLTKELLRLATFLYNSNYNYSKENFNPLNQVVKGKLKS